MEYRPSFMAGGARPPLAALIPAAGCAAVFTALSFLIYLTVKGEMQSYSDWTGPVAAATYVLTLVISFVLLAVAGFIVIAPALLLTGVPVAWALGDHIRQPASLVPIVFFGALTFITIYGGLSAVRQMPEFLALGFCWASGSAVIYRYFVIRFRDEMLD